MVTGDDKAITRMRTNANLIPIKKGHTLNPYGRPKDKNLWKWAAKLGAPEKFIKPMRSIFKICRHKPISVELAIILRVALEASRGDLKAVEIWLDRMYGKVTLPMDVSATNGPLVAILNAPSGDQTIKVVQDKPTKVLDGVTVEHVTDKPAAPATYPTKEE
jgi:hypothetical protein